MKLFKKVAFYVVHHVDPVLKAIPRYAIYGIGNWRVNIFWYWLLEIRYAKS